MLDSSELEGSDRRIEKEKDVYRKIKLLGQGAYGKAYLVQCCQDKSKWVIKQINMSDMSPEEREITARQVKILEKLDHPNIVRFRQIYRTSKDKLSFVMEYADGGDLATRIAEQKRTGKLFSEVEVLNLFTQICLAVKHVHDRKVIHRDIKGQNIFLHQDNIVKLGDFGIARQLHRTVEKAKTVVGTPYYLSPEIIENRPYSFKSDIWSLGVLLYEMCALQPPFNGNSLQFLALKIVKGAYTAIPPVFSKNLQILIKSMLNVDPNKRPSIHQILGSGLLMDRITNFLSESKRQDQFSHTILHNQNFMDRRPKLPAPRSSSQADVSMELGAPPNLLKVIEGRIPTPKSTEIVREERQPAPVSQQHFNQVALPQAQKHQKTPPVQHKTPMNGFYRPPSSHPARPIFQEKPDLADLLNIKAPPLNAHIVKAPLPKLKTPEIYKKRPSTPNLNQAIVAEPGVINNRPVIEVGAADFKKKPRYSVEDQKDIRRNCSEQKMPARVIGEQKQELPKAGVPNKSPLIAQKSPQLGMVALVPTPKPQQRKELIKPQSAAINQKKRVDLKPLPKKEQQPASKKELHKEVAPKPKKDNIKKVVIKKKQKPLQIKSEEVKKQEKEQAQKKKQKREELQRKMKEDIELKRKLLNESQHEKVRNSCSEEKYVQQVEEEKVEEINNDQLEENTDPNHQHAKRQHPQRSTQPIEEDIHYCDEDFEQYIQEYQVAGTPFGDELPKQPSPSKLAQYHTTPMFEEPQEKVEVKHSVQFRKMLEEMQQIVDQTVQRVDQLEEVPPPVPKPPKLTAPPELQELKMELTMRDDDLESVCNSNSQVDLEYSMSQNNLALECFGDHSKLEDLKITLEQAFGVDNFIAAYRRVERLIELNGLDFDEIQTVKSIAREIEGISEAALTKYFSLLVTIVYMENNYLE